MVSAVLHIDQYGMSSSDDCTTSQYSSGIFEVILSHQMSGDISGEFTPYTLYPAQNPMPRGAGNQSKPDDFSDSPTNDPSLFDSLRFAYGRLDSSLNPYGSLSYDNGQLVRQRDFGKESFNKEVVRGYSNYGRGYPTNLTGSVSCNSVQDLYISSDDSVEQFSFLLYARPIPYSIKNAIDSDVFIRLANPVTFPLVSGTGRLYLDGVLQTGLQQTPFYGGNGGIELLWENSKQFEYGSSVDVHWVIEDSNTPPEEINIEYWFKVIEDTRGPHVINLVPEDGSEGVLINSPIQFDIVDYEAGVDISSFMLYVNSVRVSSSDYTISSIDFGYRIVYTPPSPFVYGDEVPFAVFVFDLSANKNETYFSWSVYTELSKAPLMLSPVPPPCSAGVSRVGRVTFEVIDGGGGLLKDSISMAIDGVLQSGVFLVPVVRRID